MGETKTAQIARQHAPRTINLPTKRDGTAHDDLPLLALEKQFNEMIAKLLTLTQTYKEPARQPVPPYPNRSIDEAAAKHALADQTKDVEAILATLYPIELAIMQTRAQTITGLAVKARHAAYAMSQYWEAPLDQIDWDARAVRLLIEAVCGTAGVSPIFRGAVDTDR
jgi:hypothetical protein